MLFDCTEFTQSSINQKRMMQLQCAGEVLALYPGVPVWRRGEEEHLVHTVVYMHLISNQLLRRKRKMTNSRGLGFIDDVCRRRSELFTRVHTRPGTVVRCLHNVTMVSNNHTITLKIHGERQTLLANTLA